MLPNSPKNLRDFIVSWDNKFPWDLWWRKKYSIAFGSPQHRAISWLEAAIEYIEFCELESLKEAETNKTKGEDEMLEKQLDNNLKLSQVVTTTKEEEDEIFDEIDLENTESLYKQQ